MTIIHHGFAIVAREDGSQEEMEGDVAQDRGVPYLPMHSSFRLSAFSPRASGGNGEVVGMERGGCAGGTACSRLA